MITARHHVLTLAAAAAMLLSAREACAVEPTSRDITVGIHHNMEAALYTPSGPGPFPGVLVLHTSRGYEEADRTYGLKLARIGYITLVPAFLKAHSITSGTRQVEFTTDVEPIYDDLVHVLGEMDKLPKIKPGVLGVVGFSNGGYFSAWLTATNKVRAGVGYYGAYPGAGTDRGLSRFASTFTAGSAPFLILHGRDDEVVHFTAAERLDEILSAASTPHEFFAYANTGHRFDRRSNRGGDQAAAADAWRRTTTFFEAHLR